MSMTSAAATATFRSFKCVLPRKVIVMPPLTMCNWKLKLVGNKISFEILFGTGVLVIARSQLLYYVPMAFTKLVRFSSSVAFVLAALLLLWGPLAFLLLSRTKGSRCKACVTLSSISTKTNPKTSSTQSLYVSYQRGIVFSILVRMDFKQLIWSTKECCLNSLIVSLRLLVVEETVGFQCVYIR